MKRHKCIILGCNGKAGNESIPEDGLQENGVQGTLHEGFYFHSITER